MRLFAIAGCVIAIPPPASVIRSTAHTAAKLFAHRYNLAPGCEKALSPHLHLLYPVFVIGTMYVYNFAILCTVPCMIQNY
jgi:hypothetical protein